MKPDPSLTAGMYETLRELVFVQGQMTSGIHTIRQMEKSGIFNRSEDSRIDIRWTYPRLHFYAHFLLAYAIFERGLLQSCKRVRRARKLTLDVSDIAGQGINRSRLYLSKVTLMRTPFETPVWQRVVLHNDVRNAIAHRSGYIDADSKLYRTLSSTAGVTLYTPEETNIEGEAQLTLTEEYVTQALSDFEELIRMIPVPF
jgi:hypothetical protein